MGQIRVTVSQSEEKLAGSFLLLHVDHVLRMERREQLSQPLPLLYSRAQGNGRRGDSYQRRLCLYSKPTCCIAIHRTIDPNHLIIHIHPSTHQSINPSLNRSIPPSGEWERRKSGWRCSRMKEGEGRLRGSVPRRCDEMALPPTLSPPSRSPSTDMGTMTRNHCEDYLTPADIHRSEISLVSLWTFT